MARAGPFRPCLRVPSTVTAATSISADAFAGVPLIGLGQRDWNASDAQSRPIFYSLPQRRCYARHGVDRPAGRHAGPALPASTSSLVQHGNAAMPLPPATGDPASALA